jgi:NAD(P)-dependent dehydrogenase (short-subunit alcohol dehydrogenase family)
VRLVSWNVNRRVTRLDEQGAAVATALGPNARFFHCDISSEADVSAAVNGAVRHFGKLNVLYNNAAVITYGNRIADMPVEQWDRTMAINLRGPFLCAKHSIPHLLEQGGGAIIIVSSHGAFQAAPVGVADYATAKGGLVTLTYYLASEYGSQHIRTNCIAPGPVPTALNEPFLGSEEGRAMTAAFIPLGTVGAVEDVARAAVFLASDEAKWSTGAVLRVDGGMVIQ